MARRSGPKEPTIADEVREMAKGWRWGRRPVVPRSALPYAPPYEGRTYPTAWARTMGGRAARAFLLKFGLRPVVWNETSPQVHGLDNLEGVKGPVIFISNHSSHLDASIIMTTIPARFRDKTAVAAAKDYFFDVWWRSAFTALVYAGFPIERGGGAKATRQAEDLLRDGWSLVVFPEGSRSVDGWVQRFRHGTSRLAIEMEVPIVPISIRGAYAAMPRGRSWPRPGRQPISVRYGRPLHPEREETHQQLSLRMMHAVAELWDEDETTWWEARKRAARGETPKVSGPAGPQWLRTWEGTKSLPRRSPRPTWRP